jgi:hypothetical protein
MALEFAHGAIQWLSASGVGVQYTVSGLSFQPKAIRFYWMGMGTLSDQASPSVNGRIGVGFATSALNQACVTISEADNVGTSQGGATFRLDSVAATVNPLATPANDAALTLDSITSDGFIVEVLDAIPSNLTVFWEAWGGSDITVASVLSIAEPAATGNVDYTVTGFTAAGTDQVVMFAGCQSTLAAGTCANTDAGICVGFATSGNAADNIHARMNSDDASATMDTDSGSQDGECLALATISGGAPSGRAQLTQFNTNGFRLNWIARASTGRRYIALAIKGGQWKAGGFTMDTSAFGNTGTVSGLAFQPKGISFIDGPNTETASGSGVALARFRLGTGDSTAARAMGFIAENAVTTSALAVAIEFDAVFVLPDLVLGLDNEIGLQSINSDGFTLVMNLAAGGGGASDWMGYLAFADAPSAGQTVILGQPSETNTAQPITVNPRRRLIGQVVQSNSAQALARKKSRAVAQATQLNTAQGVTRALSSLGQVTQLNTAQAFSKRKVKAFAQAAEGNTSGVLTRVKRRSIGQASSTEQPFSLSRAKRRTLGQTIQLNTAQVLTRVRRYLMGQASSAESGQPMTRRKSRLLAQATSTELGQAFTRRKVRPIGQPSESNTSGVLTRRKTLAMGQVMETNFAQSIVSTGVIAATIGQVTELNNAQTIRWAPKERQLSGASEMNLSRPMTWSPKRRILNQVASIEQAQSLGHQKRRLLNAALETSIAQAAIAARSRLLAQASSAESARAFTSSKRIALVQATEHSQALDITYFVFIFDIAEERIYVITAEDRVLEVVTEQREYAVAGEDRVARAEEHRVYEVVAEDRVLKMKEAA